MKALDEIEAILSEIEKMDAQSGGRFRQAEDREAYDIAARIERKMQQKFLRECASEGVAHREGEGTNV